MSLRLSIWTVRFVSLWCQYEYFEQIFINILVYWLSLLFTFFFIFKFEPVVKQQFVKNIFYVFLACCVLKKASEMSCLRIFFHYNLNTQGDFEINNCFHVFHFHCALLFWLILSIIGMFHLLNLTLAQHS